MGNENYLTAKLTDQTVMDDFKRYKKAHGLESKSAAVRKLLRKGLEAEAEEDQEPETTQVEQAMFSVASVVIGLNFLLVPLFLSGVISAKIAILSGIVYMLVGLIIAYAADRGFFRRFTITDKTRAESVGGVSK